MPILAPHRIDQYRHIYVARSHSPVAIRDQMVRACMMIDRAIEREIISDQRPLVIAGAGVAGASAALRAAAFGVHVTLVERSGVPFGTQRRSTRP